MCLPGVTCLLTDQSAKQDGGGGTGSHSGNMAFGAAFSLLPATPPSKLVGQEKQEKGLPEGSAQLLRSVLTLFCLDTW